MPFASFAPEPARWYAEPLKQLLIHCADQGASGVHIAPLTPITVSHLGRLMPATSRALTHEEAASLAVALHNAQAPALVLSGQPLDGRYVLRLPHRVYRFRYNLSAVEKNQRAGVHAAIRVLYQDAPTFEWLGLPEPLQQALLEPLEGLMIVSGPTGSGKTTLLASVIQRLACLRAINILTLEDPIEYQHPSYWASGSAIHQSEYGRDFRDWSSAVRAAVRREPHVLLLGEMRDEATLMAMIQLCLTGHLCLTTWHGSGVVKTLSRLESMLPEGYRRQGWQDLLLALRLIVSQRLVPTLEGGRHAVWEYLRFTPEYIDQLKDADDFRQITRALLAAHGHPFGDSLLALYQEKVISDAVYDQFMKELSYA
jgi:defect-in-organelle-trafficking protein DotB